MEGPAGAAGAFREGGWAGCFALFSTVRVVALRLMGVDFPGRRLGQPSGAPIKSRRNA